MDKFSPLAVDWDEIKRLRDRAFHGLPLSDAEMLLCKQAMKADPDFYSEIGMTVRKEYKESLRMRPTPTEDTDGQEKEE